MQNSQENTCARVSYLIKMQASACNFIKNEILTQVFSCEFGEISKITFFTEHIRVTASVVFIYWPKQILYQIHLQFLCSSIPKLRALMIISII